jgi:hypothetical protein
VLQPYVLDDHPTKYFHLEDLNDFEEGLPAQKAGWGQDDDHHNVKMDHECRPQDQSSFGTTMAASGVNDAQKSACIAFPLQKRTVEIVYRPDIMTDPDAVRQYRKMKILSVTV